MREAVPGFRGPLDVRQFTGGQSNPTFLVTSPSGRYVLRRKPSGPVLRTAHAVEREFRVTRALHPLGIPVARPLGLCEDPTVMSTPFFVMEFVEGRIFWDPTLPSLPVGERRRAYTALADGLAAIHAVSVDAAGLHDFGRAGDYVRRQTARWSEQYRASRWRVIPAMDRLMDWLHDNPPAPSGRQTVIHGDFRLDNVIFAPDELRVLAIIDWELSTLGDPLADLAYLCMVWHLPPGVFGSLAGHDPAALGVPTEAEFLSQYFAKTGAEQPADWSAYLVYNLFRLGAILEGVGRRAVEGNASSARAAEMGQLVAPIAETAWALATSVS